MVHPVLASLGDARLELYPFFGRGDGIISKRNDLSLGVLTADCATVVILGKKYFGIIHAGWKGAFSGIIENALNFFFRKG